MLSTGRADPNGGTDTARFPRLRGPRTLRVRLVVTILLLIAAVCAVISVSTEVYLGKYLVRQLDSQLIQIHQSAITSPHPGGPNAGGCGDPSAGPATPTAAPRSGSSNPQVRWQQRCRTGMCWRRAS